jgi:hypothetical protein
MVISGLQYSVLTLFRLHLSPMKYSPTAIAGALALAMSSLFTAAPAFAQATALPAAAAVYPSSIGTAAGLPVLAADTGTGGRPRLQPRLEDSFLPFGTLNTIADKELRIEALALLPVGPDYAQRSQNDLLDELSAILCSVESLTGLEYWSASRDRMRLLYESVYKIDSASARKPVDSPTQAEAAAAEPGQSLEFLAFQKDTSFGANVFGYSLGRGTESLLLKSENLTVMRYLLLPFVSPGKMQNRLWVIPCREGIVLYFISTIESINFAVERVFESAGNRALALLGWLSREAAKAGLSEKIELPVNMKTIEALEK